MLNNYSLTKTTKAKQNFGLTYPENGTSLIKTIRRKTEGEPDWLVGISNNLISEKLTADRSNDINAIEKANSRLESFNIDLDGFNEITTERKQKPHIVEFTKERYKPIDTSVRQIESDFSPSKHEKKDIFKQEKTKDYAPHTVNMSYSQSTPQQKNNNNTGDNFDYYTRLSYNQEYDSRVSVLQKRLSDLGYLDMSGGG